MNPTGAQGGRDSSYEASKPAGNRLFKLTPKGVSWTALSCGGKSKNSLWKNISEKTGIRRKDSRLRYHRTSPKPCDTVALCCNLQSSCTGTAQSR